MSKFTKQQCISTAKKKCRAMVALGALQEAVETLYKAQGVLTYDEKKHAKRVMKWAGQALTTLHLNITSAGVSRDWLEMGRVILANRKKYISSTGEIDVVAGCIDVVAMTQLVTDLKLADDFNTREWKFLFKTSLSFSEKLLLELENDEAGETASLCALNIFDAIYPNYVSKIPTERCKEAA